MCNLTSVNVPLEDDLKNCNFMTDFSPDLLCLINAHNMRFIFSTLEVFSRNTEGFIKPCLEADCYVSMNKMTIFFEQLFIF